MRTQTWNNNIVYYKLKTKESEINKLSGASCYSQIRNHIVDENSELTLTNFHKEETEEYIQKYVLKLSKIFKFKYKFINDDELFITGLRSNFYLSTFLCIFRYLFENQGGSGDLNKKMIEMFVNDNRKLSMLYKFIDSFNKSKFTMSCTNHCISSSGKPNRLVLKTTKQLEEYDKLENKGFSPIHSFFNK